jgi:5-formyltetrahydrofolate cyclo-ligase
MKAAKRDALRAQKQQEQAVMQEGLKQLQEFLPKQSAGRKAEVVPSRNVIPTYDRGRQSARTGRRRGR